MSEELENEEQDVEPVETEERLQREEEERLTREQLEKERAEEEARLRAIQEHEAFLNSFPDTTVFYERIIETDTYKVLAGTMRSPYTAELNKCLDKHMDTSELTVVSESGIDKYYLKGFEKPAESLEQLQLNRYRLIDSQIEAYLDAKVKEHNYANVVSCVSYYNSSDDKYRAEARAVSEWRDHIYRTGEIVWNSVLDGTVNYEDVDLQYIIGIAGDFTWPEVE